MEWLAKKREAASRRAPTEVNIPAHSKGKRKIVDSAEVEQSCKFIAYPIVHKETLVIEAKRQQCDKRNAQRQRVKRRMEETEKKLHELKEQLRKEQELRKLEKEA